jgi:exodeoxyribonuclease VII small subunit
MIEMRLRSVIARAQQSIRRGSPRASLRAFDRKRLIALTFQFAQVRRMSNPGKSPDDTSFESALAELETIVASMEAGQLPLEQSLAAYRRGAELLKYCQSALQEAQQQVKILEDNVLKNFGAIEQ